MVNFAPELKPLSSETRCENNCTCDSDGCNNKAEYTNRPVLPQQGRARMVKGFWCHWCYEKLIQRYFRDVANSSMTLPFGKTREKPVRIY